MHPQKQETVFRLSEATRKIPAQETLWFRLSQYTTILERDNFLFHCCRSAQVGYMTLKNKLEKKRAGELQAGELATFAEATNTDAKDWLDNRLFLVYSHSGGYTFLEAEDIVSSLSTEAAEADRE